MPGPVRPAKKFLRSKLVIKICFFFHTICDFSAVVVRVLACVEQQMHLNHSKGILNYYKVERKMSSGNKEELELFMTRRANEGKIAFRNSKSWRWC